VVSFPKCRKELTNPKKAGELTGTVTEPGLKLKAAVTSLKTGLLKDGKNLPFN